MIKTVQRIPFLRVTTALALGITAASFIRLPVEIIISAGMLVILLLIIAQKFYSFRIEPIFGIGIHILFFFMGMFINLHHNQQPDFQTSEYYRAVTTERPVAKKKSYRATVTITHSSNSNVILSCREKVIAYFAPDERIQHLEPGDVICFSCNPVIPDKNENPYGFDYQKYLANKRIHRQVYLDSNSWTATGETAGGLQIKAEQVRGQLLDIFRKQKIGDVQLDIISALTLGYRQELDTEIRQIFSTAGAMHVLAVSGLHVGIIFLMLNMIFRNLRRSRYGRIVFVLIAMLVLWSYAFITGLTASVSRAATMFSFYIIGSNLKRQVSIYNSLAGSAFFLLLINPNNLFDLGFQLSYSALFGIVYLQPKLEKTLSPRLQVMRYIWQLITVSVAAQVATTPIILYTFNQWPLYFFISNIFMIPAVLILIPLAFIVLVTGNFPDVAAIPAFIINHLTGWIYEALKMINRLPGAVINIPLDTLGLFLLLVIIISFLLWAYRYRLVYLKAMLLCMLLLAGNSLISEVRRQMRKELIVYHSAGKPVLHLISGRTNYLVTDKIPDYHEYVVIQARETCKKLGLDNHVKVLSYNDSYADTHLLICRGLLWFEGKVIACKECKNGLPPGIFPDIAINDTYENMVHTDKKPLLVSTQIPVPEKFGTGVDIYYTRKQGAFVMKW